MLIISLSIILLGPRALGAKMSFGNSLGISDDVNAISKCSVSKGHISRLKIIKLSCPKKNVSLCILETFHIAQVFS